MGNQATGDRVARVGGLVAIALFLAAPLRAENLCGLTGEAEVLDRLAGTWVGALAVSVETETLSAVERADEGAHVLTATGAFTTFIVEGFTGAPVDLSLAPAPVHDVDAVDDLLETTASEVFADVLSGTRCGPESLPQLTGEFAAIDPTGQSAQGTITLIAYFDDHILMLGEIELVVEWGLAFVTVAALLTPEFGPGGS